MVGSDGVYTGLSHTEMGSLAQNGLIFAYLMLCACTTRTTPAPVSESAWYREHASYQAKTRHRVLRGETLYAIAFHHDVDYRQLALFNALKPPYKVVSGQVLYLEPHANGVATRSRTPAVTRAKRMPVNQHMRWQWPLNGRVLARFSPAMDRKGVDIIGEKNDKVHAAAAGIVAYAGHGLPGYGHLVILKHNAKLLTAYGNNARIWVHEGQSVSAGQVVADVGRVSPHDWGVHFQIREWGKPVNPLAHLPVHTPRVKHDAP